MLKIASLFVGTLLIFPALSYGQSESKNGAKSYIQAELGPSTAALIAAKFKAFDDKLNEDKSLQGYVINYGTVKAIRKRKSLLLQGINHRKYDTVRITYVDIVTKGSVKTIMWIMPEGAERPNFQKS